MPQVFNSTHSGAGRCPWRVTSSQKTDNISHQRKTEGKNKAVACGPFLPSGSLGGSGDGAAQLEKGKLLSLPSRLTHALDWSFDWPTIGKPFRFGYGFFVS